MPGTILALPASAVSHPGNIAPPAWVTYVAKEPPRTTSNGGRRGHAGGANGAPCLAVRRADSRRGLLCPGDSCRNGQTRPQGWLDELLRLPGCTARRRTGGRSDLGLLRLSPATGRTGHPRRLG